MSRECAFLCETLAATLKCACVGTLARMGSQMDAVLISSVEGFPTMLTVILVFSLVRFAMPCQMRLAPEALFANLTSKAAFVITYPSVD